ncbi:MAG: Ribosomal RNA small subunit methyltransferase A [Candidatus Omnitrophica bacterium]|nr:Ribosomal RNA small subunit methyltransferase A [Candidatus Omnitrophota bacterium]
MIDRQALTDVADASGREGSVLEIGPGLGFLTRELLERSTRVVAVEKDRVLAEYLRRTYGARPFELIEADVLELSPAALADPPARVAGNIPYGITSPILEWLVRHRRTFRRAALTVQWEVAERLSARPDSRDWAPLTIFVQMHADIAIVRKVPKSSFYPAPEVDSAVITLTMLDRTRVDTGDEGHFFRIVRAAFQQRRKTLLNGLKNAVPGLDRRVWGDQLEACGIDARRRPETLSLEEWGALSRRTTLLAGGPGRC